jgi:hypothetical protein
LESPAWRVSRLGSPAQSSIKCGRFHAAVAALAHLVLFASLAITSGFFSLEGGVTIAIPATLFAWVIATSIVLLRTGVTRTDDGAVSRPII